MRASVAVCNKNYFFFFFFAEALILNEKAILVVSKKVKTIVETKVCMPLK